MTETTEKANAKHEAILRAAQALFRDHGVHKSSVEEICEKAKVSKMTFYKHFENKTTVAISVLERVIETNLKRYNEMMKDKTGFEEKVSALFEFKLSQIDKIGAKFIEDIINMHEIRDYFKGRQQENAKIAMDLFKIGQNEGKVRKEIDQEYFMILTDVFTRLYTEPGFQKLFPDPHKRMEELLQLMLYGISDPNGGG